MAVKTLTQNPGGGGGAAKAAFGVNVLDYGAKNDGTGDQTAAINAAIAAARSSINGKTQGWVYFPRGVYRCTSLIDGTNVIDAEKVILCGEGSAGTVILIPTDMGAGKYAVNFQKTDTATHERIGLRNIAVWGPGTTGLTWNYGDPNVVLMDGVRIGNNPLIGPDFDVRGFRAGFYLFKDHENFFGPGKSTSNFYGIYYASTTSGGDSEYHGAIYLGDNKKACVGIAHTAGAGGLSFYGAKLADTPFCFWKEAGPGMTAPSNAVGMTATLLSGVSVESFAHAIFGFEGYGVLPNVSCDEVTFERCFGGAGAFDTTRLIAPAYGDGATYNHGQSDNIPSGYPQDALFQGGKINGIKFLGTRAPFIVPGQPGRADKSFLAAGQGSLINLDIQDDIKTVIDGLDQNLVGATPARKFIHRANSGVVGNNKLIYDGNRATIRQIVSTSMAKFDVVEMNNSQDKIQRATDTKPFHGIVVETPTAANDVPVVVFLGKEGNPVPVNVKASKAAALNASGLPVKLSTTGGEQHTVEKATGTPPTGTIVGYTSAGAVDQSGSADTTVLVKAP